MARTLKNREGPELGAHWWTSRNPRLRAGREAKHGDRSWSQSSWSSPPVSENSRGSVGCPVLPALALAPDITEKQEDSSIRHDSVIRPVLASPSALAFERDENVGASFPKLLKIQSQCLATFIVTQNILNPSRSWLWDTCFVFSSLWEQREWPGSAGSQGCGGTMMPTLPSLPVPRQGSSTAQT